MGLADPPVGPPQEPERCPVGITFRLNNETHDVQCAGNAGHAGWHQDWLIRWKPDE